MTVPTSLPPAALAVSIVPADTLKHHVLETHPQYMPFFEKTPLFGFDSRLFLIYCGAAFGLMHLKARRDVMTVFTYRLHIKLLQALLAQALAPMTLIVIPLSLILVCTMLHLDAVNDVAAVVEVIFSAHTPLNSLAMIVFIPAYRKAVAAMFRKLLPMNSVVDSSTLQASMKVAVSPGTTTRSL
ncbi:hypothetical protein QR680_015615 [Steinernema hermaphroditum]|uniref:G protein-coupled receptor n=1 Tax=Steinernema hermaphroditum TaxID=289476 RepID=A0AA39LKX7_9BILA|nr:hypothetical protein QR680_015615 [Steinernema hermaphroditum]